MVVMAVDTTSASRPTRRAAEDVTPSTHRLVEVPGCAGLAA
jgi:hypothetical protein